MALVEEYWFWFAFAGREPAALMAHPQVDEDPEWEFNSAHADSPDDLRRW